MIDWVEWRFQVMTDKEHGSIKVALIFYNLSQFKDMVSKTSTVAETRSMTTCTHITDARQSGRLMLMRTFDTVTKLIPLSIT